MKTLIRITVSAFLHRSPISGPRNLCLLLKRVFINPMCTSGIRRQGNAGIPVLARATAIGTLLCLAACGQHQVVPASMPNALTQGASYYLPRSVILANVPVVRTVKKPGKYVVYTVPILLRAPDVATESTTFAMGDTGTLTVAAERDPDQHYVSVFTHGPFQTSAQTYKWSPFGTLTNGTASVENKGLDFAISTLDSAASIAGALIKPAGASKTIVLYPERPGLEAIQNRLNHMPNHKSPDLDMDGLRLAFPYLL
jgi:Domain of unknown function (DUF4831)